jgi:hypothetical protein
MSDRFAALEMLDIICSSIELEKYERENIKI